VVYLNQFVLNYINILTTKLLTQIDLVRLTLSDGRLCFIATQAWVKKVQVLHNTCISQTIYNFTQHLCAALP